MVMEFFSTRNIFSFSSRAREILLKIVKDVLKYRAKNPNGVPETKFAPLIQEIVDKESIDRAGEVAEAGFELTDDPFVAQQLARLYIHASNWTKAKQFAKTATDMKGDSSFLWDTYGRVYLQELVEIYKSIQKTDKHLAVEESTALVDCAFKGMEIFKRVQKISMEDKHFMLNSSVGYLGELEMIRSLLDCLSLCPGVRYKGTHETVSSGPSFPGTRVDGTGQRN